MADPLFQTLGNLLVNGTTDRQGALKILSESRIHQYNDSREYYSYIEKVGSKFPGDAEIGVIIRKYILPILYERDAAKLAEALGAIDPWLTIDDVPLLISLVKDGQSGRCSDPAVGAVYSLAELAYSKPEVQKLFISLLPDERYSLAAAVGLGKTSYPGALDIILDKGMKDMFRADWAWKFYFPSIRPYGPEAEKKLLDLLAYPNAETQEAAKWMLAEMKSAKGHDIVSGEFQEYLEGKRELYNVPLMALILFGDDPWPIVLKKSDCKDFQSLVSLPDEVEDSQANHLQDMLLKEDNPDHAKKLICLTQRILDSERSLQVFEFVQKSNLKPEIKDLLPKE